MTTLQEVISAIPKGVTLSITNDQDRYCYIVRASKPTWKRRIVTEKSVSEKELIASRSFDVFANAIRECLIKIQEFQADESGTVQKIPTSEIEGCSRAGSSSETTSGDGQERP